MVWFVMVIFVCLTFSRQKRIQEHERNDMVTNYQPKIILNGD